MKGLALYEWRKLFSGRAKWMHALIHVLSASALLVTSGRFEAKKVLVLEAKQRASMFMQGANDMLYLVSMVYAVWLASRLFMRQETDVLPLALFGRVKVTVLKWVLGGCLLMHHAAFSWGIAFLLFNTAPYHMEPFSMMAITPWFMIFTLQGYTFFSLLMGFLRSAHSLTYVLGGLFLMDILRADAFRPEVLNHLQYISFVMMPSMLLCRDGTLVMVTSAWPVFLLHGLYAVLFIAHALIKRY